MPSARRGNFANDLEDDVSSCGKQRMGCAVPQEPEGYALEYGPVAADCSATGLRCGGLSRCAVVVAGGVGGVVRAVEEHRNRGVVGAGEHLEHGLEADLV